MAWYATGSVQVAANGSTATGSGTKFLGNVRIGDGIVIAGSTAIHEVTGVSSDTQLTFAPPYAGSAGSGKAYRIAPLLGYDRDLSDAFNALRGQFGGYLAQLAELKEWAYAASADAALSDLGFGAAGKSVAQAATVVAAREAIGAHNAASLTEGLLHQDRIPQLENGKIPGDLPPQKAFRRGNIIGLVSQAGGVPTGAIIEQGSNAAGVYIRLADGTQICYQLVSNHYITNSFGGLFRSTAKDFFFPAEFIEKPQCLFASENINIWGTARASSETIGTSLLYYPNSISVNYDSSILTIGRWF